MIKWYVDYIVENDYIYVEGSLFTVLDGESITVESLEEIFDLIAEKESVLPSHVTIDNMAKINTN